MTEYLVVVRRPEGRNQAAWTVLDQQVIQAATDEDAAYAAIELVTTVGGQEEDYADLFTDPDGHGTWPAYVATVDLFEGGHVHAWDEAGCCPACGVQVHDFPSLHAVDWRGAW